MTVAAPAPEAGAQSSEPASPAQSSTPSVPDNRGSLIPSRGAPPPEAAPTTPQTGQPFTWPEWVPEQFRAEKVTDRESRPLVNEEGHPAWDKIAEKASTSWKEATRALSEKQKYLGAPEADEDGNVKYEIRLPEGADPDAVERFKKDKLWVGLQEKAKAMNLNQKGVDELVEMYFAAQPKAEDIEANIEAQLSKLRFKGYSDARIAAIGDFFEKTLDPEDLTTFHAVCSSAEGVLLFDRLMNRMVQTRMLPTEGQAPAPADPLQAIRDRYADPRNSTTSGKYDPDFAEKTEAMLKEFYAKQGG